MRFDSTLPVKTIKRVTNVIATIKTKDIHRSNSEVVQVVEDNKNNNVKEDADNNKKRPNLSKELDGRIDQEELVNITKTLEIFDLVDQKMVLVAKDDEELREICGILEDYRDCDEELPLATYELD